MTWNLKSFQTFFLTVTIALSMGACASMHQEKKIQAFKAASKNYTEEIRWQKFSTAAKYVDEKNKDRFFQFYEGTRELLTITDYNILSADIDKTDPNKARARVYVNYFSLPDVSQKQGLWLQEWSWNDVEKTWVINAPEIVIRKSRGKDMRVNEAEDGTEREK